MMVGKRGANFIKFSGKSGKRAFSLIFSTDGTKASVEQHPGVFCRENFLPFIKMQD